MVKYPNEYDTFRRVKGRDLTIGEPGDIILPSDHNDFADAIETIEQTLGIYPQGTYQTVAERISAIEQAGQGGGTQILTHYTELNQDVQENIQYTPLVVISTQIQNQQPEVIFINAKTQFYVVQWGPGSSMNIDIYIDETRIYRITKVYPAGQRYLEEIQTFTKIPPGQHSIRMEMVSNYTYTIRINAESDPDNEYGYMLMMRIPI
jgi:hypothetical protein